MDTLTLMMADDILRMFGKGPLLQFLMRQSLSFVLTIKQFVERH